MTFSVRGLLLHESHELYLAQPQARVGSNPTLWLPKPGVRLPEKCQASAGLP